jgi:hypothetical protein
VLKKFLHFQNQLVPQIRIKFDLDAYASFSNFPKMLALAVAEGRLALRTPTGFKDPDELWIRILRSEKMLGIMPQIFLYAKMYGFPLESHPLIGSDPISITHIVDISPEIDLTALLLFNIQKVDRITLSLISILKSYQSDGSNFNSTFLLS